MEKVYIFGHKKPDTDTVCGAIALSYLKDKMGFNTEPRILGEINSETSFVLKKFNTPVPRYLNDVKTQVRDVKYKKNFYVNENDSIFDVYHYMNKKDVTGIPIVDDNRLFMGYVSFKEMLKDFVTEPQTELDCQFDALVSALEASSFERCAETIKGSAAIVNVPYRMFINTVKLEADTIVITENYEQIIEYAINKKVKLIVVVKNGEVSKELLALAKKQKVSIIITPHNLLKTARTIGLANPIKNIQRITSVVTFEPNTYLSDFLEVSNRLKHTNYPIVNGKGICEGILRVIDTHDFTPKKVILVDHNEPEQSVDGLAEAEIIEIVDHHNIGSLNTSSPVNFRNMSVGSVNTIIYYLFLEQGIKIPKQIAGLMLSGIISDTLLLASPTTTELDRNVATILAKTAKLELETYGLELLRSGVSIEGLTPTDVIYKDFKNYAVGDNKFGIAQVFTTSFKEYQNELDDYIKSLNEIALHNNYKVVCLFITDIINNNSYVLFNESAKKYLEDAYNIPELKEGTLLKGFVSRKKQMVPPIMEIIEKI